MFKMTLTAMADCVRLGINAHQVRRKTRYRGSSTVRLPTGEPLRVIVVRRTIVKIRPAISMDDPTCAAANQAGLDTCKLLRLLGNLYTTGTITFKNLSMTATLYRNTFLLTQPVWLNDMAMPQQ